MRSIDRAGTTQLSPALRVVCLFNAVAWALVRPPWFHSDAISIATASVGAGMWALLGLWGNQPGWPRRAGLLCAGWYAGMLLAQAMTQVL